MAGLQMSLTIAAGVCKGMKLVSPRGDTTRPTRSVARAAVMNSLQGVVAESSFLDLFAGTGAVGLEALSRGARSATFVESNRQALRSLNANITELQRRFQVQKLTVPAIAVHSGEAVRILGNLASNTNHPHFDLIWADPPYALTHTFLTEAFAYLPAICAPGSQIIVESDQDLTNNGPLPVGWIWQSIRTYGRTMIHKIERVSS